MCAPLEVADTVELGLIWSLLASKSWTRLDRASLDASIFLKYAKIVADSDMVSDV